MTTGLCAPPVMGTASGNAIANKTTSPIGLTKFCTANECEWSRSNALAVADIGMFFLVSHPRGLVEKDRNSMRGT